MIMAMTFEEKRNILFNVLRVRWPQDCEPAVNPDGSEADSTNYELIRRGVDGKEFTEEGLYNFVMELRAQGLLVKKPGYGSAPEAVDPKKTIPHRDLFPKIDSIEKAIHFVKNAKIPGDRLKAINELLAYLQLHGIHDGSVVEEPETAESDAKDGSYGEACDPSLASDSAVSGSSTTDPSWKNLKLQSPMLRTDRMVRHARYWRQLRTKMLVVLAAHQDKVLGKRPFLSKPGSARSSTNNKPRTSLVGQVPKFWPG